MVRIMNRLETLPGGYRTNGGVPGMVAWHTEQGARTPTTFFAARGMSGDAHPFIAMEQRATFNVLIGEGCAHGCHGHAHDSRPSKLVHRPLPEHPKGYGGRTGDVPWIVPCDPLEDERINLVFLATPSETSDLAFEADGAEVFFYQRGTRRGFRGHFIGVRFLREDGSVIARHRPALGKTRSENAGTNNVVAVIWHDEVIIPQMLRRGEGSEAAAA